MTTLLTSVALTTITLAAWLPAAVAGPDPEPVTYARDVAPVVNAHCAPCHRPGASAPFSLLDYESVRQRGRQIVAATASRAMPPSLPEPGLASLRGGRGLTDDQIDLVRRWVEQGSPAGAPPDPPFDPPPAWFLGPPDLVLTLPEAYVLPAGDTDVYRRFVFTVPIEAPRWVRAVEVRPGNPEVVRHAVVRIDRSGQSRRDDAMDAAAGAEGLGDESLTHPGGLVLTWSPGRPADAGADDLAWRLAPGTDVVVELHLAPGGEPERIQPAVGLTFAAQPPTRQTQIIPLRDDEIDIPPGATDYAIEDDFVLPVPVRVTGVYPLAHGLGRSVEVFARQPDGATRWLLKIPDWNLDWREHYRLGEPIDLAAGTTLGMRIVYDNSADNPRNPNRPPAGVAFGPHATDERGTVDVQVVPGSAEDAQALARAIRDRVRARFMQYAAWQLERDPRDAVTLTKLGIATMQQGDLEQAAEYLERAVDLDWGHVPALVALGGLRGLQGSYNQSVGRYLAALEIEPERADVHYNVSIALLHLKKRNEAIRHLSTAVRLDPLHVEAAIELATVLVGAGRSEQAIARLRRSIDRVEDPRLHFYLAGIYAAVGRTDRAVEQYRAAVRLDSSLASAWGNLGAVLASRGELDEAIEAYETLLEIDPGQVAVRSRLGNLLLRQGRADEALAQQRRAAADDPGLADAHFGIAGALATKGNIAEARPYFLEAARLAPDNGAYLNSAAWLLATDGDATPEQAQEAVRLAERAVKLTGHSNATILDTLAASYAAAGRFDDAIRTIRPAIGLARTAGDDARADRMRGRLELYQQNKPYRE